MNTTIEDILKPYLEHWAETVKMSKVDSAILESVPLRR